MNMTEQIDWAINIKDRLNKQQPSMEEADWQTTITLIMLVQAIRDVETTLDQIAQNLDRR